MAFVRLEVIFSESFYHERPAPPNVSSFIEMYSKILPAQSVLLDRRAKVITAGMSKRSLESSSSRIMMTFSDQVPLFASEPKTYIVQFEERHMGKQMNGLMRHSSNLLEVGRETEGIADH